MCVCNERLQPSKSALGATDLELNLFKASILVFITAVRTVEIVLLQILGPQEQSEGYITLR